MHTADSIFDSWPGSSDADFHRDGIIDEARFASERRRVLFVMAEPSSRGPGYAHLLGKDLRWIYREALPRKPLTRNTALWTEVVLDGRTTYEELAWPRVADSLRRIAIINVKKVAGAGSGDYRLINEAARRDRELLLRQAEAIAPNIVVVCGPKLHESARELLRSTHWEARAMFVNHPSVYAWMGPRVFPRVVEAWAALRDGGALDS